MREQRDIIVTLEVGTPTVGPRIADPAFPLRLFANSPDYIMKYKGVRDISSSMINLNANFCMSLKKMCFFALQL